MAPPLTASDIKAKVIEAVEEHMKGGGCAAEGNLLAPCVACRTAIGLVFSAEPKIVHYADTGEKYYNTACGEMVGNVWHDDDVSERESDATCQACLIALSNLND